MRTPGATLDTALEATLDLTLEATLETTLDAILEDTEELERELTAIEDDEQNGFTPGQASYEDADELDLDVEGIELTIELEELRGILDELRGAAEEVLGILDELRMTLEELTVIVEDELPTILLQVERAIQLLLFSQPQPLWVLTQRGKSVPYQLHCWPPLLITLELELLTTGVELREELVVGADELVTVPEQILPVRLGISAVPPRLST